MSALEVSGLEARYGRARILFDVALDVGAGEAVALLGRNGAGKSTTLRSILGLVPHRAGRIVFGGEDISDLPTHEIVRRGLGYVPEDRRIFTDLTTEENLLVGRRTAAPGRADLDARSAVLDFSELARIARPARSAHVGRRAADADDRPDLDGQPLAVAAG